MATLYINFSISSVVGSFRNNPFLDAPIQLLTEAGDIISTEVENLTLSITTPAYDIYDRNGAAILDRAGSPIYLRS